MHPHLILAAHHAHQQNALMGGLIGWVAVSAFALVVFHGLRLAFRTAAR